eukprot:c12670_g1_i1.p1 GENE.c12670_g1_i1~~c12670_g1_i1.p1  ORF type:complete len:202 (+),score=48.88 c12670_g1_i1:1-606(+)
MGVDGLGAISMVRYAKEPEIPAKSAKARGSNLRVSFKNTRETVAAIRGLGLRKAQRFLKDVIAHKQAVPFTRFCGGLGRTRLIKQLPGGLTQGRFPEKCCKFVLDLLTNAESNAELRGLNIENLFVSSVQVNAAQKQRRRTYRAHGRINPFMSNPSHIELVLTEAEEAVSRPEDVAAGKRVKTVSKKKQARERMRSGMTVE